MTGYRFHAIVLLAFLAIGLKASPKGALVIIGGALRSDNAVVYEEMVRLVGGAAKVQLAIIAAASSQASQTGRDISADFQRYGVLPEQIRILPIAVVDDPTSADVDESGWRRNGFSTEVARSLQNCNLVFFSGGDQSRYRQSLLDENGEDSPVLKVIREIYEAGAVIAGTSAGAAVMSDPMIVSGTSLSALTGQETDRLSWDRGFGLLPGVIVDQHFIKRGRVGRLLAMLLHQGIRPGPTRGLGIDEDTAIVVQAGVARVLGRSGLLIVDADNGTSISGRDGMKIKGARIHYLHHGDSFLLRTGEFRIAQARSGIEIGKEYHEHYPSSADVFGRDTLVNLMTEGLADCRQQEIFGLSFDPSATGLIAGVRLRLYKTAETAAYMGRIDGEYTYSVLNVGLECKPVKVRIDGRCRPVPAEANGIYTETSVHPGMRPFQP